MNKQTKHTPGPWHVGMKPGPIVYGPIGEQVADLTADLIPKDERLANLRLIAAAPELLAALRSICWQYPEASEAHEIARLAISKATSR